jgi:hypothetical protein
MDTSTTPKKGTVKWLWKGDNNQWNEYDQYLCLELEQYYQNRHKPGAKLEIRYDAEVLKFDSTT